MTDTVATGARQYLAALSDVTAVLGAFSLTDTNPANAGQPFLFSDDLLVNILNYPSTIAVVLGDAGGWQVPQPLNTWRFRRLRVDFYVDPTRDSAGNVTETSALTRQRGLDAFRVFQRHLQRRDPDTVLWGDMVTMQCQLLTEPQFNEWQIASGSGITTQVGTAFYGVSFSGWTDAPS